MREKLMRTWQEDRQPTTSEDLTEQDDDLDHKTAKLAFRVLNRRSRQILGWVDFLEESRILTALPIEPYTEGQETREDAAPSFRTSDGQRGSDRNTRREDTEVTFPHLQLRAR